MSPRRYGVWAMAGPFLCLCGLIISCGGEPAADEEARWTGERREMTEMLRRYGIRDGRVLAAMRKVRRHQFIPAAFRRHGAAYGDHAWPIGHDQTISQPFIVAYMTEKLGVKSGERVLEIGTGSGYQAAVLAELAAAVYSVEIVPELARHARRVLAAEGYADRVHVLAGDGYRGWPEHAPFDAIIVTCAPEEVPPALVAQLKDNGRMILPAGSWAGQRLLILRKEGGQVRRSEDLPVRFVPMVRAEGGTP